MNKTYIYCKTVIENKTYESVAIMQDNLDIFLLGKRITQEEYKELVALLNAVTV